MTMQKGYIHMPKDGITREKIARNFPDTCDHKRCDERGDGFASQLTTLNPFLS